MPGLGLYRSERRFIQISPNEIAILHKMTVRKVLLSADSLTLTFGKTSATLVGADKQGNGIRAKLVESEEPSSFTFEDGDWRSVYSAFRSDSFVLDVFTDRDGVWTRYLQTIHRRVQ